MFGGEISRVFRAGNLCWRWSEMREGWQVCTLAGHSGPVGSTAFSPDGKWVLSGSEDTLVKIWDVATRLEVSSVLRTPVLQKCEAVLGKACMQGS